MPPLTAPNASKTVLASFAKCQNCKIIFEKKRWWQKFCTSKCKSSFHNALRIEHEVTHLDIKKIDPKKVVNFVTR